MSAPDCEPGHLHSAKLQRPEVPDGAIATPWANLWPLDPGVAFLNHGSFGSCPRWVVEQYREIQDRLEREPLRFIVEDLEDLLDHARQSLADFVNADALGLAFVTNATEGVNAVVRSMALRAGDELLTNTHEYNACNNALRFAAERARASVVTVEIPFPVAGEDEVVERIVGQLSDRTRLVLLSHVTSPTALVLPVQRIVDECNRRGIETLIDGAHAPGMVPIDLRTLNATYYTGNCHKWLCAPKGAGILWVREDRRADVRPTVISHAANSIRTDRSRFIQEFDYTGTRDFAAWLCVPLCISYLGSLHTSGWPGLMRRNHELALRARDAMCKALEISPPAPDGMLGSMAAVPIPSRPARLRERVSKYHDALQDDLLRGWGVQAPIFVLGERPDQRRLARVSCQLYNSAEQVERYAQSLAGALRAEAELVG